MIWKTRRSASVLTVASTRSETGARGSVALRSRGWSVPVYLALVLVAGPLTKAESIDPEIGRMLERALLEAESFRKELPHIQYEAKMRVQEWDGRGRLRGTARATALVRPGDKRSMIFISREVEGKVRLPDDNEESKDDAEKEVTLPEFAREHRIAERFAFNAVEVERIAGESARRVSFQPKPNQAEKNTADRFLDAINGTAWVSEEKNKLIKFEMRLTHPFRLFWIFAVLKDLCVDYELISPGEILGHAKLKIAFTLSTPISTIRQVHELDLDNFQRRAPLAAIEGRPEARD